MKNDIRILLYMKKFKGGPSVFRRRLNIALRQQEGVTVINDPSKPFDVELCFIRLLTKHRKPRVLRVDGCYYKPGQVSANNELRRAIRASKHIVFQSDFSKTMIRKFLSVKPQSTIIYNGIDQNRIDNIEPDPSIEPGSFVSAAGWRPNKRPETTIRAFLEASTGRKLYLLGNPKGIPKRLRDTKNVVCLGDLDENKVISVMKSCQYMIHLCHIDSCPNAVVEGLSCGLNVICTNLGGTKELVKKNGIVLDIDRWNFRPNNFSNIDKINTTVVAGGIRRLIAEKTERASRPDLDISNSARDYVEAVRKVL